MEIESKGRSLPSEMVVELASSFVSGTVTQGDNLPSDGVLAVKTVMVSNDDNVAFKVPLLYPRQRAPLPLPSSVESVTTRMENGIPDGEFRASSPPLQPSESTDRNETRQQDSAVESARAIPVKVPYDEPSWSGVPPSDAPYSFEILKGGVVVGSFDLGVRPYIVCGRHLSCDLVMEHPSISRHHAVIQYRRCDTSPSANVDKVNNGDGRLRPDGFYVYDLGSTHGTFLNKNQLKPLRYYRLFVGHMLRFGGSSRTYLMQGPDEDCEEESPLTVTELNAMRRLAEQKAAQQAGKKLMDETSQQDQGIDWGMGEDAVEDEDDKDDDGEEGVLQGINPFSLNMATPNEDTYIDDPKKTLRSWFEREGFELEYDIEEKGQAHFLCKIRLPLDHLASGEPVVVEASVKGKKKEAVAACALEACRTLDRQGVLKQSKQEGRPRKKRRDWAEDDYYDSEDDTFLDRTGIIEKKRQQRMQKAGDDGSYSETGTASAAHGIETYESLLTKYAKVNEDLLRVEEAVDKRNIMAGKTGDDEVSVDDSVDALDAYMKSLRGGATSAPDKTEKSRLKITRQQLKREAERLARLIKIARPTALPRLVGGGSSSVAAAKTTLRTNQMSPLDPSSAQMVKSGKDVYVTGEPKTKKTCSDLRIHENSLETPEESSKTQPDVEEGQRVDDRLEAAAERTETKSSNIEGDGQQQPERISAPSSANRDASSNVIAAVVEEPKKKRHKAIRKSKEAKYDYDKTDPNYAMWIPPDDQSGDGRTSLNEKYGY